MKKITKYINQRNLEKFNSKWDEINSDLTEKDKQKLLTKILDEYYNRDYFSFYKNVFNKIIGSKLNLNFNIEHWAPTFLSLVVLRSPTFELFEYFIKKGAKINFIGDCYEFEDDKTIKQEVDEMEFSRYSTCLDFIGLKLADLLVVEYNFYPPSPEELENSYNESEKGIIKELTIGFEDYHDLLMQSEYLWNLINTDKLKDHIVSIGGKTFEELKK